MKFIHSLDIVDSLDGDTKRRKKRSRWGGTAEHKVAIPGMPTSLPPGLDSKQQEIYLRKCLNMP